MSVFMNQGHLYWSFNQEKQEKARLEGGDYTFSYISDR